MNRLYSMVALFLLFFLCVLLVGTAQNQFTLDATKLPETPPPGRGPFPRSASPGHSANRPIRLDLLFPTRALQANETTPVDFVITNIGTESIMIPSSIHWNFVRTVPTIVLTLWLTSEAIKDELARDIDSGRLFKIQTVVTSAKLYGMSDDSGSFHELAPNESMRVHASSGVQLNSGTHSFTGHAELLQVLDGRSERIGTADADVVTETLSTPDPSAR